MKNKVVEIIIRLKDRTTPALKRIGAGIGGLLKRLTSMRSALLGFVGAGGVLALFTKSIKTAFRFEAMQVQLMVLVGSMSKAREQFKMLRDFSASTPFEIGGIVDAYQQLQTFTDGALTTERGLRLVGDAAAGRGKDFAEVAYWVGRLYSSLKNGDPFMDAVGSLQRLGIAGGTIRGDLTRLTEASADFSETWAVVEGQLLRFEGGMRSLSQTGEGLFSTLKDNWTIALATFGDAFMDHAKGGIQYMIDKLRELTENGSIEAWAEKVKNALDYSVALARIVSRGTGAGRSEILGNVMRLLTVGIKNAALEFVAILTRNAPKIGGLIYQGLTTWKTRPDRLMKAKKELEGEGKLEDEGWISTPKNRAAAARNRELIRQRAKGASDIGGSAAKKVLAGKESTADLFNALRKSIDKWAEPGDFPTPLAAITGLAEITGSDVSVPKIDVKKEEVKQAGEAVVDAIAKSVEFTAKRKMATGGFAELAGRLLGAGMSSWDMRGAVKDVAKWEEKGRKAGFTGLGGQAESLINAGITGFDLGSAMRDVMKAQRAGESILGSDLNDPVLVTNSLLKQQNELLEDRLGGVK